MTVQALLSSSTSHSCTELVSILALLTTTQSKLHQSCNGLISRVVWCAVLESVLLLLLFAAVYKRLPSMKTAVSANTGNTTTHRKE
jgi:hypothetical protein